MGFRNWLAKNLAGAGGYGIALGNEVVTNGIALGRLLIVSGRERMKCKPADTSNEPPPIPWGIQAADRWMMN